MFHLDLQKGNDTVTIDIQPTDTSLGKKWARALHEQIEQGVVLPQPDRIYNLNNEWTESSIIKKINQCIDIVNQYDNFIDYTLVPPMTQDDSNHLHHYFEKMRGENDEPNEFYKHSPQHVKEAIEEFNVQIHRWEDLGSPGRIVVHIKDRPMYDLELEDFGAWTTKYLPGDVCINYCHKGKPITDVFKDGDTVIGEDNIRPQSRYSADFSVGFNYGIGYGEVGERLQQWLARNENFLSSLGYPPSDPRSAIGKGVVGKIVTNSVLLTKATVWGSTRILDIRYS